MSLARTLMNGVVEEKSTLINAARYGHSDGASVIAMESVAELHEIFMEEYNYEQADLAALSEGVALEGSQYEAIAEAATKGVFQKVKDFFAKLWEKVKAFFHNVIRFVDAIFKSGKDFVKKYKKDIDAIKEVKDLTVTMHNFDNTLIDEVGDVESATAKMEKMLDEVKTVVDEIVGADDKTAGESVDEFKKDFSVEAVCRANSGNKAESIEELRAYFMETMVGGDAEEKTLSAADVKGFAGVLEGTKGVEKYSKVQAKLDSAYKKAIKMVGDAEAKIAKSDNAASKTGVSKMLSTASATVSLYQNIANAMVACAKAAFKRRDAEYKHAIMAAFRKSVKA